MTTPQHWRTALHFTVGTFLILLVWLVNPKMITPGFTLTYMAVNALMQWLRHFLSTKETPRE